MQSSSSSASLGKTAAGVWQNARALSDKLGRAKDAFSSMAAIGDFLIQQGLRNTKRKGLVPQKTFRHAQILGWKSTIVSRLSKG